ncbi:hypothetical protein J8273_6893 [Carpediemonas membranifera]|uniref:SET domain-containing protein n=1 Tax=Carpediemonas membranifera TaxID=201153 RepID=A0A8J6B6D4_9EUKA|nr:hypothetical protein J8273_7215 [Carpediemonas membranifera]KAG9391335.1 hypothetical protein J8273_7576 [Carpediemonas membranifera]KAG9391825.1 hypothetical protein J8273_6893 [Carpediemonas membranifera]|eukprot:KAG9390942.1 hypothetical protein J8273_7215 [Carpediemonas membranifera]
MKLTNKADTVITAEEYQQYYSSDDFESFVAACDEAGIRSAHSTTFSVTVDKNGFNSELDLAMVPQHALMGPTVGDGILTNKSIPNDAVIGIYCGKIIPEPEPGAVTTYVTRLKKPNNFAVDSAGLTFGCHKINDGAAFYNVVPGTAYVNVQVGDQKKRLPVILYLADRAIAKFEYLSIEYGEQYWRGRKPMALYPFCLEKMLAEAEYEEINDVLDAVLS